jgi:hypothetical protein
MTDRTIYAQQNELEERRDRGASEHSDGYLWKTISNPFLFGVTADFSEAVERSVVSAQ